MSSQHEDIPCSIGVYIDTETIIQQLQDVLERYSSQDIIREIVQNADDAGAGRLVFFVLETGIPAAVQHPNIHPLLRCSAMLILRECPAYTLLCQFSPKDTGQSKVKQSHKIDEVTTVASAQAPKSLQPGKCPFHYPAAGWIPPAFTDFFPPAADMLLKSVNIDFLADSWIIIPLVQTEVSNFSPQKPAAHFPRVFQGCSYQAAVMDIGACDRHSQRNTLTVHMEMNLTATSPSVRRVASKPLSRCFFVSASALAARCRP